MSKKTNAFALMMDASRKSPDQPKKKKKIEPRGKLTEEQKASLRNALMVPYEKFSERHEYEEFYRNKMAPFLLNQVELVAGGERLVIKEIEFYFTSETHPDPFTHCQPLQEQNLIWYFHRYGKSYKSGTYKGLDIAIGRGSEAPGGILIRTVEQLSNGKIICGPCNTVDHILKLCGAATINTLVETQMKDDISVFGDSSSQLYLYPLDEPRNDDIIHTGRVGLYMTKKTVPVDTQAEYVMRNYRSVAEPKKVIKGRHLMALSLCHEGSSNSEISRLTGIKENIVKRYHDGYLTGLKEAKDLSVFAGKRISDGLACECLGAIIANRRAMVKEAGGGDDTADDDAADESEEVLVDISEESEEIEDCEEECMVIGDIKATVDLNCLIPWMRWKLRDEMSEPGNNKQVEFHPFPHCYSTKLFGELLANTKATNKTLKGFCFVSKQEIDHMQSIHQVSVNDLEKIFGKEWWKTTTKDGKEVSVKGKVSLSIICSQAEGKLILQFKTK